jgi:hypothetical protein
MRGINAEDRTTEVTDFKADLETSVDPSAQLLPNDERGTVDPRARRPDGMPRGRTFERGNKANPRGRPKSHRAYLRRKLGEHGEKAIDVLLRTAMNPLTGDRLRVEILTTLLERGWGKPTQDVKHGTDGPIPPMRIIFGGRYAPDGKLVEDPNLIQRTEFGHPDMKPFELCAVTDADIAAARERNDDDSDIRPTADRRTAGNVASGPATVDAEPDEPEEAGSDEWTLVTGEKAED